MTVDEIGSANQPRLQGWGYIPNLITIIIIILRPFFTHAGTSWNGFTYIAHNQGCSCHKNDKGHSMARNDAVHFRFEWILVAGCLILVWIVRYSRDNNIENELENVKNTSILYILSLYLVEMSFK